MHHIVPKHAGGLDNKENLIKVLPEEHLFLHNLRYKAYNDKKDFIAVRFIVNGFENKQTESIKLFVNQEKFRLRFARFRQSIYYFRKKHSWHTKEGLKRISESRKGKKIGRCVETGEIVGVFDSNDQIFLSGKITHHSKGRHVYYHPETKEKIFCKVEDKPEGYIGNLCDFNGTKNPRYSNITDEEIIEFVDRLCYIIKQETDLKIFPPMKIIQEIWNKINTKTFPNLCGGLRSGFRFDGDIKNLIDPISKKYCLEYSRYSKQYRKNFNQERIIDAYHRIYR